MAKRKRRKTRMMKGPPQGPLDPLLSGRFQLVITTLAMGAANEVTMVNLVNLLREMRHHHAHALRIIWGCFLVIREDSVDEEKIKAAKDIIIEKIASYWGVKVTQKQLEPKMGVEWNDHDDLVLPYNVQKLPTIRKKKTAVTKTTETPVSTLEDQLEAGEFDIE